MLICPNGLKELDVGTIEMEAKNRYFLVLGPRDDKTLCSLIPMAENVFVIEGVCDICKGTATFANEAGTSAICRGCKQMELERIKKIDAKLQSR